MAIEQEIRGRAHDLYVIDGMTLEQVAREADVPESTVKRWSADEGWAGDRAEYRASVADIKRKNVQLKRLLLSKALVSLEGKESIDSQDMHGFRSILAAGEIKEKEQKATEAQVDRPKIFLDNLQWIAAWLSDHDPEGLKVLAASFDEITETYKTECLKNGNA